MRLSLFASGSGANCALLRCGTARFLIDAGLSALAIRRSLADAGTSPAELDGIFITHEHSDHVSGLPVLLRRDPVPVYAPGTVASRLCAALPGVEAYVRPVQPEQPFTLAGVKLLCFPTPHDTPQSVGWRFEAPEGRLAFATDTGCVTDVMLRYLSGADAAVIEANHDERMLRSGSYPPRLKERILSARGHLSNDECARLARMLADSGVGTLVLAHLSRENNTPQAARDAVAAALVGTDTRLFVAPEKQRLDVEVIPCCAST